MWVLEENVQKFGRAKFDTQGRVVVGQQVGEQVGREPASDSEKIVFAMATVCPWVDYGSRGKQGALTRHLHQPDPA
jgi:hypothetical protein